MFKNYLKVALRNVLRYKAFSFINILSLSVGIASFLVIALWVQNELQYNRFHEKGDRLYRVLENQHYAHGINTTLATPGLLKYELEDNIPEVSKAARITWVMEKQFKNERTTTVEKGIHADSTFFEFFSFPFVEGDVATAFQAPNEVVISKKLAEKYFPDQRAVGQTLEVVDEGIYTVSAVMEKIPSVSSLQFDYVLPYQTFFARNEWLKNWGNNGTFTWVLLKEGADLAKVQQKIKGMLHKEDWQKETDLFLQCFEDSYLYTNFENGVYAGGGGIQKVRMLGIIGLLIMLICCINFMNLSTAFASRRAKEIGIRKVAGAKRFALVYQFFTETLITVFFALLIAVGLTKLSLPYFNDIAKTEILLTLSQPEIWMLLGSIFIGTTVLAATYPSLLLSSFKPVNALANKFKKGRGQQRFRQSMVVGQFTVAIALIICTGVVVKQINYLQEKDLGYAKEQLLYLPVQSEVLGDNYDVLKAELLRLPAISSVSSSNTRLSLVGSNTGAIRWEGKAEDEDVAIVTISTNYDFIKTADIGLLDGRDFSPTHALDSMNFIINEAAAKVMGMENPVGQKLNWGDDHTGQIVGLVKDFHISPLRWDIDPMMMYLSPGNIQQIYIKLETKEVQSTLAQLETIVAKYNPNAPFEYEFASDDYNELYQSELSLSKLAWLFAGLSIFTCCLGLLGLTIFATEQRTKEIGIRKVLGASIFNIVALLSKDFIRLVLLAFLVATPIAWYLMHNWLTDYAYRIELKWWMFALAGVAAVGIALFTLSIQSVKAALANPVESLRSE